MNNKTITRIITIILVMMAGIVLIQSLKIASLKKEVEANDITIRKGCETLAKNIETESRDYAYQLQLDGTDQQAGLIVDKVAGDVDKFVRICGSYSNQETLDSIGKAVTKLKTAKSIDEIIDILRS